MLQHLLKRRSNTRCHQNVLHRLIVADSVASTERLREGEFHELGTGNKWGLPGMLLRAASVEGRNVDGDARQQLDARWGCQVHSERHFMCETGVAARARTTLVAIDPTTGFIVQQRALVQLFLMHLPPALGQFLPVAGRGRLGHDPTMNQISNLHDSTGTADIVALTYR